jgi:sulfur-oxidizing protein SoxZ
MARALVNVPARARKGEIIEIKALIGHPMETGFRPNATGQILKRDIIRTFSCTYNGEVVFAAEMFPATSANPYLAFFTVATESGTLKFSWEGDNGFAQSESATITVTP